jgi:ATP-dependent Clp protease ATP-binding subunit ClpC
LGDRVFHLFVRKLPQGYWAQVLGHDHLAAFGATMNEVRDDLTTVCQRLLDRGELREAEQKERLTLRRVDLSVRAMQRGRLLSVPMRFTVLLRGEKGPLQVLVPRLGLEQTLHDPADFDAFAEELIRHELYLSPLEHLLDVAYAGEESVQTLTVSTKFNPRTAARKDKEPSKPTRAPLPPGLAEACRRLSDELKAGTIEHAFQRDADVEQLAAAVSGRSRSSVLLVGPPLVGKTALLHELVQRAAQAKPGTPLHGLEVYSTSGSRIVAGMRYLGEWQDRVRRMVASLRTAKAVLHLDSLGELLAAGTSRDDTGLDIARQLLPSIEAGEIAVVLEATPEDAARAERTHAPFLRALRAQHVKPLLPAAARQALASSAHRIAKLRRVQIADPALERAVDLVDRFGEAGGLPGGAIELLRAGARAAKSKVGDEEITKAFVERTGYPREIIDPGIPLDPEKVLERLRTRVVGQDDAMTLMRNLIVTLKTGLCDPSRPLGAYLLLGPTGVGKTESALSLCSYLFGDEKRLTRFDMAEYAAFGSAQRLITAGNAQGGSLTARVRAQPFGVVLLDEIEKADAGVHDLLLQLLGEGRLTDSAGRTVSFRNTVVLLTSNLGADAAGRSLGFGGGTGLTYDAHYTASAAQFFRPELVNRLDQIVVYRPLSKDHLRLIAERALQKALEREGLKRRGVTVKVGDGVLDRLAALGFDERYGARPLKRAIEAHAIAPIAAVLAHRAAKRVELVLDETGAVTVQA